MASSNFKIFDENKANMLSDGEYNTNAQRLNGVQQGVASSQLQNKTLYQLSLLANAFSQIMVANGVDCNDTDAVTAFVNNVSNTFMQRVANKATEEEIKAASAVNKYVPPNLLNKYVGETKNSLEESISDIQQDVESAGTSIDNINKTLLGGIELIGKVNIAAANTNYTVNIPNISKHKFLLVYLEGIYASAGTPGISSSQEVYCALNNVYPASIFFRVAAGYQGQSGYLSSLYMIALSGPSSVAAIAITDTQQQAGTISWSASGASNTPFTSIQSLSVYSETANGNMTVYGVGAG